MHVSPPARTGSASAFAPRGLVSLVAGAALVVASACDGPPVEWSSERIVRDAPAPAVLTADGAVLPDTLAPLANRVAPPSRELCPGSLALARAGRRLYAVWWSVRADSGAGLLAARSDDEGASWSAPSAVDTTDASVSGCRRSPPSFAADSASGYVHVAYALRGREGPGLFFAHSMDGGATFHEPVPIFYGERLGLASVAADGDVVAVAFEDPNSANPRVGLALSRTMGHIFEQRLLPVSSDNGIAARPLAAVRGHRVAVAWERRSAFDSARSLLAVKTGVLR
jgi:hypothetical protein